MESNSLWCLAQVKLLELTRQEGMEEMAELGRMDAMVEKEGLESTPPNIKERRTVEREKTENLEETEEMEATEAMLGISLSEPSLIKSIFSIS